MAGGKPEIVSGGTQLPAIWPSEVVGLYTILSLEEASMQDFRRLRAGDRSAFQPQDPC